jgi:hypothetical protein
MSLGFIWECTRVARAGIECHYSMKVANGCSVQRKDRTADGCHNCPLEKNNTPPRITSAARFSAPESVSKKRKFTGISADF